MMTLFPIMGENLWQKFKPVLLGCSDRLDSCGRGLTLALQCRTELWLMGRLLMIMMVVMVMMVMVMMGRTMMDRLEFHENDCLWDCDGFMTMLLSLVVYLNFQHIIMGMILITCYVLMVFCQHCQAVGANLVCRVSIVCNPAIKKIIFIKKIMVPVFLFLFLLQWCVSIAVSHSEKAITTITIIVVITKEETNHNHHQSPSSWKTPITPSDDTWDWSRSQKSSSHTVR